MKKKHVKKSINKNLSEQHFRERKLKPSKAVEDLDSDFIVESYTTSDISEATERKKKSKERVVESGFKSMTLNFDYELMELLNRLYEDSGLKYTERSGKKCFKTVDLSAMVSYLISSKGAGVAANDILGYKIYLYKILSVVKFRKESQCENAEQICDFLNTIKFKRYSSSSGIKNGSSSKWEPQHLSLYLDANDVDDLYEKMAERRKIKMKKIMNKRKS